MPDAPTAPTILTVDDEANSRKMLKLLLEREGFKVFTAANGEEGLLLAKVERPAVILLDVMMPKMDGHETLKRLRADQDTNEIPVIMVTARGTEHDIAASFRLGAVFHVEKPYETKDLLQKIHVALTLKETP
jgi:two-component system phosphate regulon response regulator PhoB